VPDSIQAFLDDSITDEGIVCAAAVFPLERLQDAESALRTAKVRIGVPVDAQLHCRILFAGDARRGTPWENVEPDDIYEMAQHLCDALRPIGLQPVVCLIDRTLIQPRFPAPGFQAAMPSEKESASLAYCAVANHLVFDKPGIQVRIWIDPDSTRIPWGLKKSRADRTRTSFWIDLGVGQEPLRVEPQIADRPKPLLLEVADLYAYITVQAHSDRGGKRVERFKKLYDIIKPQKFRFHFPDGPQQWQEGSNPKV
jgi:hypothetical protein